ncbi:hypothetical protein Bbelb_256050 [Branchiostoma belcheri]|nr:hypothetical protein Bbelb_256050 [Branchiostoma belcheri]
MSGVAAPGTMSGQARVQARTRRDGDTTGRHHSQTESRSTDTEATTNPAYTFSYRQDRTRAALFGEKNSVVPGPLCTSRVELASHGISSGLTPISSRRNEALADFGDQ